MAFNPAMLALLPQAIDALGKIKEMFAAKERVAPDATSVTQNAERILAIEEAQMKLADVAQQMARELQDASEQFRRLERQVVVLRWTVVVLALGVVGLVVKAIIA